jgi:TetR/AcrR family transcriptional regulator
MSPESTQAPESLPQRMSGDNRRRQLIEVAIDLFSRKGFGGTTTKEIAAAAGVTEAVIFRHFATKQDLYQAILDTKCACDSFGDWMGELQAFMDRNDDQGLFRFLLEKILQFDREDPKFCRLLMHAALEGNELALMHNAQMAMPLGAKFKEYIARRQAEGSLRAMSPSIVIFALAGIPKYYAMQKYMYGNSTIPITDEEAVTGFLEILMAGLRPRSEESSL